MEIVVINIEYYSFFRKNNEHAENKISFYIILA